MKPFGELFLEQKQSRRLGVDVKEALTKPQDTEARPTPWARPHTHGPLVAPLTDFFCLYISVGERSNFKKIPTHMQDHGDA